MKKKLTIMTLTLLAGLLVLSACGLLRDPETASGPIEAIPLPVEPTGAPVVEVAPTEPPATEAAAEAEATEAPAEATAEPVVEDVPAEAPVEEAASMPVTFTIDQAGSQVRFELDEDLRGQRITVVGTTDQVAGQLALDLADLSTTQVGAIQINARTLLTDNNFRNRAIQNEILDTGLFEFITFTPTAITGLPASAQVGETVQFTLLGDLTIREITQPASFNVTATAVSDTQLVGAASTVIQREAFDLIIPSVPNVANVEEEVELYIDFTATAS